MSSKPSLLDLLAFQSDSDFYMTQVDPGPSGRGTMQAVLQAPFLSALRRLPSLRQQQLKKIFKKRQTRRRDEFSALQQMGTTAEKFDQTVSSSDESVTTKRMFENLLEPSNDGASAEALNAIEQ